MKDSKIKTIIVKKIVDDKYIESKEGEYFDEKHSILNNLKFEAQIKIVVNL